MKGEERPETTRPLFDFVPPPPESQQEIANRKEEAKRVVKRLAAIIEDHRQSAIPLDIKLGSTEIAAVVGALREHARSGTGTPVPGARDEVHGYVLNRLFDELVEEPSNILFTTKTGPDTIRYDAMSTEFWLECLDYLEATFCPPEDP